MKKKIANLGSTGSIGKSLLNIISKDKDKFKIVLLTANKNHQKILNIAKKFKVKNIIITNLNSYKFLKIKTKGLDINIYNNFKCFNKVFKKKIDYTMSSIVGLDGLLPTLNIIKHTKKIAIANKESLICGWNIINKEIKKNKTEFVPVDSEHFSIWSNIKKNTNSVKKIYLTASGGPFLNLSLNKFKNIKMKDALMHPSWKMGKKISIDSSTLMNKVYEVIEAKNIFNISYKKLSILSHPNSYVHAIVHYDNGMINLIAHQTNMEIPIINSLYTSNNFIYKNNFKIDLMKLNDLKLNSINSNRFPVVKLIKSLPKKNSLFETVLVTANDELVKLYLSKKIEYHEISKKLLSFVKKKEFNKYKNISPRTIKDILKLSDYVRLKIHSKSI